MNLLVKIGKEEEHLLYARTDESSDSPDRSINNELRLLSTFPLLCSTVAREGGTEIIPAVKYCYDEGSWAIFPLSKIEVGIV